MYVFMCVCVLGQGDRLQGQDDSSLNYGSGCKGDGQRLDIFWK